MAGVSQSVSGWQIADNSIVQACYRAGKTSLRAFEACQHGTRWAEQRNRALRPVGALVLPPRDPLGRWWWPGTAPKAVGEPLQLRRASSPIAALWRAPPHATMQVSRCSGLLGSPRPAAPSLLALGQGEGLSSATGRPRRRARRLLHCKSSQIRPVLLGPRLQEGGWPAGVRGASGGGGARKAGRQVDSRRPPQHPTTILGWSWGCSNALGGGKARVPILRRSARQTARTPAAAGGGWGIGLSLLPPEIQRHPIGASTLPPTLPPVPAVLCLQGRRRR